MPFDFFVLKICNIIFHYSLHQSEELRKDLVFQIKVLWQGTKLHIFQQFILHDIKLGWNGRQAALQSPECSKLKCKYANKFVRLDVIVLQPCFRLKSKHFEFNSFFSRLLAWGAGPYNTTMKLGCEEDNDLIIFKSLYVLLKRKGVQKTTTWHKSNSKYRRNCETQMHNANAFPSIQLHTIYDDWIVGKIAPSLNILFGNWARSIVCGCK